MLSALIIKQPYEVSFSGNPMPYSFGITPYGATEKTQDIRLIIRIMVENTYNTGFFSEIKSQQFIPDESGQVSFDVSTLIDPYLEYQAPKPALSRPIQAIGQRKRYRVDYLIQKDGAIVGTVENSPVLNAVKGGMAYDQWHPSEFFTRLVLDDKQPLHFTAAGEKIFLDELRFLFWVYPYADNAPQTIMFDVLLDDNSIVQYNMPKTISAGKWGVCCAPIQLSRVLPVDLIPADRTIVSYTVSVKYGGTAIVAPVTYVIDHRNFYKPSRILYRNSLGGIDTITLRGQIDFEADYARQQVQRTVPPAYFSNLNLQAQFTDTNNEETPKFKGDTGFLNQPCTDKLRDLFLSTEKWEQPQTTNHKLVPVSIITKNTKFFSNQENLVTTVIEWLRAYVNEFYTPAGFMPATRVCPPVESLQVSQLNKSTLQITYALPIPYDRIKIELEIAGNFTTLFYAGNARSIRQAFINPIADTTSTEDIIIRAWCICDVDADPMEMGPVTEAYLTIYGNTPPVANDDTYNISVGYNTPLLLTGSVMANDYDPDGDPLEVVAVTGGPTNAGGTYDINAAGIIHYLPPSSIYTGQDYFDYELREVGAGSTVTARVYINVGSVSGQVYVKLVIRNNISFPPSGNAAEFWADYFADPAGTIPIDVTSLALNIEVNMHTYQRTNDCTVTTTDDPIYINPATGTKNKFWEGAYQSYVQDPDRPCPDETYINFNIVAGTGYIVI